MKTGHGARNWKLNRTCSVDGCGRKLTKFLHPIETEQTETSPNETATNQAHAMCKLFLSGALKEGIEHLTSTELINANTEAIFIPLQNTFTIKNIPWTNLVSILKDSCNV